ncbi:hypothetical protein GCM10027078_29850 [Nocardioides flavus (ex Wang et al. 2016)]|nr:hypothetical protein [Nocardioides flavus (ex Wang et al. 2016)]
MNDDFPLRAGDTAVTAQMSPCVGGLVRTWVDGGASQLWSTPDADWLLQTQATGHIGRTSREDRRFREAGVLAETSGTLMVQGRFPVKVDDDSYSIEANMVRLEPAGQPSETVFDDFRALLTRAIQHCLRSNEFLVVELGGWDAPEQPFCLFVVVPDETAGPVSVIETAPDPVGSQFWDPHIVPGRESQSLRAPATPETIDVAPILMIEAISRWGIQPWDVALTFGQR